MQRLLADLFGGVAATAARTIGDELPRPFAAELAAIAGASPRRRREFLAGRACAHAALLASGRAAEPIGRAATREPLWPAGVVGSISHAGDLACAAVAHAADAWGLGLDIEVLAPPLDPVVERMVLRPGELAGARDLARIAFAAKECLYKCLFPSLRWPLGFHDVHVELDLAGGCFRAVVDGRFRSAGRPLAPLDGRLATTGDHVLAGLLVRRDRPPPVRASAGPGRGTGTSPRERRPRRAGSSAAA